MDKRAMNRLARDYMQIWNAGRHNLLDEFADEQITAFYTHFEKTYCGISAYKAMLKKTHDFFPDMNITIKKVIPNPEENNATVTWKYTGTHQTGELFGIESSGREVNVNGMTLLQINNEKVAEEKGIVDNMSLMMQLGALG